MTQRRRLRVSGFQAMFQQSPPPAEGDLIVREEWVKLCLDVKRDLGQTSQTPGSRVRVVSVDPGLTKFSGIIVADLIFENRTSPFYLVEVLDIRREFDLGNENLVRLLSDLQQIYHADCLIYEANVLKAVKNDSNWESLQSMFPYVVAHNTGQNKRDEQLGAAMSRSLWEFGRLRLPWGTPEAQSAIQPLIDEGLRRLATDDLLMSLWFIYFRALKVRYYGRGMLATSFDRGIIRGLGAWKGWEGQRGGGHDPQISWPVMR